MSRRMFLRFCLKALAVLSSRPTCRSLAAHLVDVRARFPLSGAEFQADTPWRERALLVEEDLDKVKRDLDQAKVELLDLRTKLKRKTEDDQGKSRLRDADPAPLQKKKKRKAEAHPDSSSASQPQTTIVDWAFEQSKKTPLKETFGILSAYHVLRKEHALKGKYKAAEGRDTLLPHSQGVVLACSQLLSELLRGASTVVSLNPLPLRGEAQRLPRRGNSELIRDVTSVLCETLAITLPLLTTKLRTCLLGSLAAEIVTPIVRSFGTAPLSVSWQLINLQSHHDSHQTDDDARGPLVDLLLRLVEKLREMKENPQALGEAIIFHGMRSLELLFASLLERDFSVDSAANRASRVARLARKDALWYLVSALHIGCDAWGSSSAEVAVPGCLVDDARQSLERFAARMVLTTDAAGTEGTAQIVVGEVERALVLALVERMWIGG